VNRGLKEHVISKALGLTKMSYCRMNCFESLTSLKDKLLGVLGIRQTNFVDLIWKQQDSKNKREGTGIGGKVEDKRLQ
jgi:hypothetical protein